MLQLKQLWRSPLLLGRQHQELLLQQQKASNQRSLHVCCSHYFPRQARRINHSEQLQAIDVTKETQQYAMPNKSPASAHSIPPHDYPGVSYSTPKENSLITNLRRVSVKEDNPVVLKCQEILDSLPPKNSEDDVEYAYKTNFGRIRFDSDNISNQYRRSFRSEIDDEQSNDPLRNISDDQNDIGRNDLQSLSNKEEHADIDRQYFGDALDRSWESKSSSIAEETSASCVDAVDTEEYIDRQFFGNALDRDVRKEQSEQNTIADPSFVHSKQDINNDKDLNYIDEIFFKDMDSSKNADDKIEGTIDTSRNDSLSSDASHTSQDSSDIVKKEWFSEKEPEMAMDPSECKSDFEQALLDMDDHSSVHWRDPRFELTPRAEELQQTMLESFKKEPTKKHPREPSTQYQQYRTSAGEPHKRNSPEFISQEQQPPKTREETDSFKAEQQQQQQERLSSPDGNMSVSDPEKSATPSDTIDVSTTNERLFKMKKNESKDPDNETAFDYVLKLRKEQKEEKMQVKGADGKLFVPRYKKIVNSVWDLSYRSREEMARLLKSCIIYNDNDMVAIFKPYGLRMHSGGEEGGRHHSLTVEDLMPQLCQITHSDQLYHIHRLDVNTTGILMLARTEEMAKKLRRMFKEHTLVKTYLTITKSVPSVLHGLIDIPLKESIVDDKRRMGLRPVIEEVNQRNHGGTKAVTKFKVLSICNSAALLSVQPLTGVKHQIRSHLGLALNCPILADHKYSSNSRIVPQKLSTDILDRLDMRQSKVRDLPLMLHASSIFLPQFADNGSNIKISCPPPPHFTMMMKALKLNSSRNVTDLRSLDFVDLGTQLV